MTEKLEEYDESIFLFDKSMVCDICNRDFFTKVVKTGKARFIGVDDILKPIHDGIDVTKYDIITCPYCGYSSCMRTYGRLTPKQRKTIKQEIGTRFRGNPNVKDKSYSYDEAIRRCKLALYVNLVSHAKTSENAYTCLRLAWLYRGAAQELENNNARQETINRYRKNESNYIEDAYKWFLKALQTEYPPLCGMDDNTINYLLVNLAAHCGYYEDAKQFGFMVLNSKNVDKHMKEKVRDVLDLLKSKNHREIK